jgi:tRNA (guanine-N7-)-methyltransferase
MIAFVRRPANIASMVDIDDEPSARRGTGAFFGRRKGHRLRSHQAALLETLLPRLAVDLTAPAPADLAGSFPSPATAVHLEIGFGGGERLIGQAQDNPQVGFIGCEPFVNGMAKALAAIEQLGLVNVRMHHGDATELLAWLPSAALRRVELMYPDPWPKRRHWKRRFVQDGSIGEIARVLEPGGEFRFATDWADYAAWTLERALRSPAFAWSAERADDWRLPWPDFGATRYEAKARREGRTSCYFTFVRV